jgi:lysophospholipase L1-like esterase
MYNPASILHTVERCEASPRIAFLTLGTNHVYRLKESGEIVDNCQKRPAVLFTEEELTVAQCADFLCQTIEVLRSRRPDVHVVMTVSPIRYRKYGYHESQLSKATLLLAIEEVISRLSDKPYYFPAYEIMNDELRDYRFYAPDMLHPSEQAVDYIWERLVEACFSPAARQWLEDWRPIKQALAHKPFDADSEAYKVFMDKTMLKIADLRKKYTTFAL